MISLTLTFIITAFLGVAGLGSILLVSRDTGPEQAPALRPTPADPAAKRRG